ncbi:MAG: YceI family protein [Erythrobacter sp.]|uniref:YceI family protein n=1 Tax=Erythrobacter sp. TaxID=1042 RepID=UPI0026195AFF|nr:YceI family protein [Erythrobacter sp.]MDJ0978653.1 YceI family protein [Erythrobacter sp.]
MRFPGWTLALIATLVPLAFTASAQVAAPVSAPPPQTLRYSIDQAASSVSAKVSFFGLASKTARFPKMEGDVKIVPDDPEAARIDVTFDATALEAPDSVTLERLRGEKFFWVEKYPKIRFVGETLKLTSATKGKVKGQLTARGVTKPATLSIEFDTPPLKASAGQPIRFTGKTTIDRREYGMKSYQLIVGNKVKITLSARMQPA